MAAGILAGITGNRANGILIDDPVAGREQADSETIRVKTKEEYQDSIDSRLLPGGWVILIQTRWHQDDLAGGILPENYAGESGEILCRDGQKWTVLNIPAKCEHADDPLGREIGEYLWTEWFPDSHWQLREHNPQGVRTWAALFQQRPSAGSGLEFKREDFMRYDPDLLPGAPGGPPIARMQKHGASDVATKQDHGDFTEHCIGGLDQDANLFITDWWYGQKTTDKWVEAMIAMVQRHRPLRWAHESGPIDHAVGPAIRRAMREHKPRPVYTILTPLPSIKGKAIKLSTLQSWVCQRRVYLPLKRPWADRVIDQLCNFPAGKYDDAADAIGLLARLLDAMADGTLESEQRKPSLIPFSVQWLEFEERSEQKVRFR